MNNAIQTGCMGDPASPRQSTCGCARLLAREHRPWGGRV